MKRFLNKIAFLLLVLVTMKSSGQNPSIKKQAQTIISSLKKAGDYPMGAIDTLIDLNADKFKDLLIEYYGASGTGLKNRIMVYLYDSAKRKLKSCETLNSLGNPTFYFDKKTVAGYYIANGGGYAAKLKWYGLRLDTLEYIEVDVTYKGTDMTFFLTTRNYVTKTKSFKILHTMELPKEYNYWDYKPVIKRNGS